MFKALAFGAAAVAVGARRTTWEDLASKEYTYEMWLEEHGSKFPGSKEVFEANLAEIRAWNADSTKSWKKGVNKFSALTREQFKHLVIGAGVDKDLRSLGGVPADLSTHVPVDALPASLDWREKGVVTPVKDQGGCGGCWSFSAAETLESHIAIKTGKLFNFSEQEILACTPNPNQCGGTGGCNGATQELAFDYVSTKGIVTEEAWPYEMRSGTCDWSGKKPVASITNYATVPFNNYTALMNAVVSIGPIAVSGAAEPWMSYETGVFDSCTGNSGTDVDHAIVLEGYGTDSATGFDYWLVRNSWSASWGEGGYIRLRRYGSKGSEPCGTDYTPGDGDGCKGGPSTIKVCGECGIMSDSSYPIGGHLV